MKQALILSLCFLPLAVIWLVMKLALWFSAINEETNYEDNNTESLSEEYDFNQQLHDNLLKIKSIVEAQP